MDGSFVIDDGLNRILGHGDLSILFLRLFNAVKGIQPDAIIRGNKDIIGVSLPSKRYFFYVSKKGNAFSIKFRNTEIKGFSVEAESELIQLAVTEAQQAITHPELYETKHNDGYSSQLRPMTVTTTTEWLSNNTQDPFYIQHNVDPTKYADLKISQINMSTRARHRLQAMHVSTFSDLLFLKEQDLVKTPQLGSKTLFEINSIIQRVTTSTLPLTEIKELIDFESIKQKSLEMQALIYSELMQINPVDRFDHIQKEEREAFEKQIILWARNLLTIVPRLTDREKEIASRRIAFKDTLNSIAIDYDISRERIRQICLKTIRKIHSYIKKDPDPILIDSLDSIMREIGEVGKNKLYVFFVYLAKSNKPLLDMIIKLFIPKQDQELFESKIQIAHPLHIRETVDYIDRSENTSYPKGKKSTSSKPLRAGMPWTENEDMLLLDCFRKGFTLQELSSEHERTAGAIVARLARLTNTDRDTIRAHFSDRNKK